MIIDTFNSTYLVLTGIFVAIGIFLCIFLSKKSKEFSRTFLLILYLGVVVYYCVYKGFAITDLEYCEMLGYQRPYILNELPFNACNVLLFSLPFALIFMNESLLSCVSFFSFLTAAMALIMPSKGFTGVSILNQRVLGYYITHYFVALETPLLICSGLYKPKYKDCLKATLTLFIFEVVAYLISFVLVKTGLNPIANYFFTMNPDGNPVLEILYGIIPIPCVYLFPTAAIAIIWTLFVTMLRHLSRQLDGNLTNP